MAISAQNYTKQDNFVTIPTPGAGSVQTVRLQVINPDIIRVEASPKQTFPERASLVILPQPKFKDFTVSEEGKTIKVATQNVCATVNRTNGHVSFTDSEGNLLLGGDRQSMSLTPFIVPERELGSTSKLNATSPELQAMRQGYTYRVQFESPDDEAFYGLGHHQEGNLNWKGQDEELYQYNTKNPVPFILSTRGYGLLFDTYSFCRWGNPNPYQQLGEIFDLYNKDGKKGCLTGTYIQADGKQVVRDEDSIYYEDAFECKRLPEGFNLKDSHVVYEGTIVPKRSYGYRFMLYHGGYARVFIGGHEVVPERFSEVWNPCWWKFSCQLVEGVRTPIRIEWRTVQDIGFIGLRTLPIQTREEQNQLSFWSEMAQEIDYYFIRGNDMDKIISGYRTLSGHAPVAPRWALGFWQSRTRYVDAEETIGVLAELRRRHIPVDNIVQDWQYWKQDEWGSHDFDLTRFPDPKKFFDGIHSLHGHSMLSVWPKFYTSLQNYKEFDEKGWIYRQIVNDGVKDWVGPGYLSSFYDAYSPDARRLFWKQIDEHLYSKYDMGIDSWWLDASEPTVQDRVPMWYRKAVNGPTAMGTGTEFHNAFPTLNVSGVWQGQREVAPGKRFFSLTRAAFTGLQHYGAGIWSGDNSSRWEGMRAQMAASLNYCLSGIPYWSVDIGGFYAEPRIKAAVELFGKTGEVTDDLVEWRELMTRWTQYACFVPIFRAHGEAPWREIWEVAPEGTPTYNSILWWDKFRYRMMPYLYSMAGWVHFRDYTMLRALVMDFADDMQTLDIKDQWMFGPSLMACPVGYYKARSREVYLPKQCAWYDLYTGKHLDGGQTILADAPYDKIPVYAPAGAILPFGPEIEWSDEKPADDIVLYVYAGRNGSFQLYEDENVNNNYERGKYSTIDINYDDADRTLTIAQRKGSFPGMLKQRTFRVVYVTPDKAYALDFDPQDAQTIHYNGKSIRIKL